ncbi:hypothetical protein APR41_10545 [Salegentibacter salinarum]|uniref:Short-chain dehydrogenase n=1 Tax=Salegentibacter salinarum TaxID=447422 RepID=A0A2N0TNA8_9FLAO|nr:SDR family NAD(P)-dependent oxidoreductase [Salegentibacter salinarum]PKD16217.1 hypothetical protein APR41_10545 [Salegentibacter salinarum]SKB67809.1 hypothetical protein SAMN05660903_01995 [Salegentibacter salinarum]
MSVRNKKVLITGGSSGIGKAIVKKLYSHNHIVIVDKVSPEISHPNISFLNIDLEDQKEIALALPKIAKEFGVFDLLLLNAGRGIQEKLTEGDPERWQEIINLNLMAPLRFIRKFVPQMMSKKAGDVVIISSVAAHQPHPYGGIYSATKTALEIIADTLRLEVVPFVRVTTIVPGITDTRFFQNQISGFTSVENLNMGAISPDEIADDLIYALTKKKDTAINKIITRPVKQSF